MAELNQPFENSFTRQGESQSTSADDLSGQWSGISAGLWQPAVGGEGLGSKPIFKTGAGGEQKDNAHESPKAALNEAKAEKTDRPAYSDRGSTRVERVNDAVLALRAMQQGKGNEYYVLRDRLEKEYNSFAGKDKAVDGLNKFVEDINRKLNGKGDPSVSMRAGDDAETRLLNRTRQDDKKFEHVAVTTLNLGTKGRERYLLGYGSER